MEFMELVAVPAIKHEKDEKCPFCIEKDKDDWVTHNGEANNSRILRDVMKNPDKLTEKCNKARPKDGKGTNQGVDERRFFTKSEAKKAGVEPTYPVYIDPDTSVGDLNCRSYSDEAHHALSGNQILKGHKIEKLTSTQVDGSHIESDTGYSVNNCANGVCLPSYPTAYRMKSEKYKKHVWSELAEPVKYHIMKKPMADNKGQAHIGPHDIAPLPVDREDYEDQDGYDDQGIKRKPTLSYPEYAVTLLDDLYDSVLPWSDECPFCQENGNDSKKKKEKLPPPYRVNKYLDNISNHLIKHVKDANPDEWEYYLSVYAKAFKAERSGKYTSEYIEEILRGNQKPSSGVGFE